jgi:hypothetical protein
MHLWTRQSVEMSFHRPFSRAFRRSGTLVHLCMRRESVLMIGFSNSFRRLNTASGNLFRQPRTCGRPKSCYCPGRWGKAPRCSCHGPRESWARIAGLCSSSTTLWYLQIREMYSIWRDLLSSVPESRLNCCYCLLVRRFFSDRFPGFVSNLFVDFLRNSRGFTYCTTAPSQLI